MLYQSFAVTMPSNMRVGHLRQYIFGLCRHRLEDVIRAADLLLYRVSVSSDAELAQLDLEGSLPLAHRATIGALFADRLGPTEYILVVDGMMQRCGLIYSVLLRLCG